MLQLSYYLYEHAVTHTHTHTHVHVYTHTLSNEDRVNHDLLYFLFLAIALIITVPKVLACILTVYSVGP